MAFRFDPQRSVRREVRRVVAERLGAAVTTLESLDGVGVERGDPPPDVVESVHAVRKRCKEVRGLAQLVRPALGSDFAPFNALVRDAAGELGGFRDAHAGLATFEHLVSAVPGGDTDPQLQAVRRVLAAAAEHATHAAQASDPRIEQAHRRLVEARGLAARWKVPKGVEALTAGLQATYRRGRQRLRDVRRDPTDETIHEWRKAVKQLWYQVRLLEPAAPSVLGPVVEQLDALSEALGDDHDLAVLVERFEADPDAIGGPAVVERVATLARAQQGELRTRAVRLGRSVYAERPPAFVDRVAAYWRLAATDGPELPTGGIADLHLGAGDEAADTVSGQEHDTAHGGAGGRGDVERERKFLVDRHPAPDGPGAALRQGYLAIDHPVSVRIRDAGHEGCTLTIKGGSGATRAELEWPIAAETFETLWDLTGGRRIAKTRHRLPYGRHMIELDVFHDALDGLVVAEVEFSSDDDMAAFEPPSWFGRDVTDDHRYTNAWLAEHGLDDRSGGDEPAGSGGVPRRRSEHG